MKEDNVIQRKSYDFAVRISLFCYALQKSKNEYVLSKQLLRSGTSIGANIEEAIGGQSRKDFFAKLTISYKEARETHYWLRLLKDSNISEHEATLSLMADCEEILRIITAIQKTMKQNDQSSNQ